LKRVEADLREPADLSAATAFDEAIGATRNPQFSDTAACMAFSEAIHVMLLTSNKFATFTRMRIADARETTEVSICIDAESREAADGIAA
jgi:uncharacterized protein